MEDKAEEQNVEAGYKVTAIGAITNLLLSGLKFFVGIAGNSTAMVADAVHSISDLATDVVVYFSLKISAQEPDEKHPYGHGRAETIGAAIIGAAVLFVGLGLAWEVFEKVIGGKILAPTYIALYGAVGSILAKEWLYRYTKSVGESLRSESIIANAWHHRTDAVSSVAALIGIGGAMMGLPMLDPLAAIIVAVMVAGMGWKIFWDAIQNLMDTGVTPEELERMEEIIATDSGVIDHHELKTRRVGNDTFVDVHIQVSPRISVSEAHNIAESVRKKLREQIEHVTDALVHIDAEDDLAGRHYKVSRKEPEELVKKIVADFPGAELDGEIILHFLLHQVCADVTVKLGDDITIAQARETADRLADKILESGMITEAVIHHDLCKKKGLKKENKV